MQCIGYIINSRHPDSRKNIAQWRHYTERCSSRPHSDSDTELGSYSAMLRGQIS